MGLVNSIASSSEGKRMFFNNRNPKKNLYLSSQAGVIDILMASAILAAVVTFGYYISQDSVNQNKLSLFNKTDQSLDASIKYFYEAVDCCKTLEPFKDDLNNCNNFNSNAAMEPSSSSDTKNSVVPLNRADNPIFSVHSDPPPEGFFADYLATKDWNISLRCVEDAASDANDDAADDVNSLVLHSFADKDDRLTNKDHRTPKVLKEHDDYGNLQSLCACSQIFKWGYDAVCDAGITERPKNSYGRRVCSSPIPAAPEPPEDEGTYAGGAMGENPPCNQGEGDIDGSMAEEDDTYQTIFLSSIGVPVNQGGFFGDIDYYDGQCQSLADAAGLVGVDGSSWGAIMSSDTLFIFFGINARDRISVSGEIRNAKDTNDDGDPCSGDQAVDPDEDLWDDSTDLLAKLNIDESGDEDTDAVGALTGSDASGYRYFGQNCASWKITWSWVRGRIGNPQSAGSWLNSGNIRCNSGSADHKRIYCIDGQ